jgi:hypothetical protein
MSCTARVSNNAHESALRCAQKKRWHAAQSQRSMTATKRRQEWVLTPAREARSFGPAERRRVRADDRLKQVMG